jgi:arsenite methyltransferase
VSDALRQGQPCRIFEHLGLEGLAYEPLRPGGLELTVRAVALAGWPHGARILDLGCGSGAALAYLRGQVGLGACGIDPSAVLLDKGHCNDASLPLIRAQGEDLPLVAASVDGILAECSLSLAADVDRVLQECFRVMKDGALLLIHDVYIRNPEGKASLGNLPIRCCLAGAVSQEEWPARLATHGFKVKLWEDRSAALKEFAARLIFTYGSLEAFWYRAGNLARQVEAKEIKNAVIQGNPGYFLLMAQKT